MHLTILSILFLVPSVLAGDNWENFTNNLATDLAPLITLFGDRLTKQFLSESINLLDNVIFALSPLGVLTTVVSVIRVCGGSSLRAFIGRAQEGPAEAESELLPCVSESTAELFNDRGISRVFGRPKILEVVAWENENVKAGERSGEIGTLLDAIKRGAWSVKGTGRSPEDWGRLTEVGIPNLSLNKGIKRRDQFWFYCAAILGSVLQIGVVIYAAVTVFVFPEAFKKNGEAVSSYAFPFFIIGTTFLFIGMFFSAVIIERASKEYYIKPRKPSKIYWLQPGNQNVGDQVFGAFLAVKEGPNSTMTTKLRYVKSTRDHRFDGEHVKIYLTLSFTMFGFVIQFIGLRALHASVILASLGATFIMSILRTCLRTERMAPDENKLMDQREATSHKQQELDCFAFHLEDVESFNFISSASPESDGSSLEHISQSERSLGKQLIQTRTRLAELTSKLGDGLNVAWDDIPIRHVARRLARTMEATMDLMSDWSVDLGTAFELQLTFECKSASPKWATPSRGAYSIGFLRCGDAHRWRVDTNELEAIIGLWTWSLYKSDTDNDWRQPLNRLVGLSQSEAGQEETYVYFHKWIFRQTEAKMVSSAMIDVSRRLFGFDSDTSPYDRDILVVKTDNELEVMVAQDIYIHFLLDVFERLSEMNGDVDVSPGLQNSFVAQSSRMNELMHCFERCSLGSREDALLCIVPALRHHHLLPIFSADCANIKKRIEDFIRHHDWKKAFQLVEWICQRSEGPEFEYSIFELGYLCRRALLDTDKAAQQEGFRYTCKILDSNIRKDFLDAQRISPPSSWSKSPDYLQQWQKFSKQLGWVAWHISINVPGMAWMQERLKKLNAPENLNVLNAIDSSEGVRVVQEWLTLNHIDFERQYSGNEDQWGYYWALSGGHFALLYFVLKRWVELGADCPTLIQHAFAVAARNRCDWGIRILQRQYADINLVGDTRVSALMDVVVAEDLNAVRTLLTNGANPNGNDKLLDKRPLILAAQRGFTDIVELLLQHGATLEILNSVGLSALYWASNENRLDTARLLLSHGADVNKDADGSTPLHSAVTGNQTQMVELLLDYGANINAPEGNFRQTSLMIAARSSFVDVVHLLLARGADLHARDDEGLTALDWARRNHCQETAAILETAIWRQE